MLKKNNYLVMVCVLCFLLLVFAPIITLYFLEDKNVQYLNSVSLSMMDTGNKIYDNAIINMIYARYNNNKYNVDTTDEYDYSVPEIEIDGERYINESLVRLKELESIGLLKSDFFEFLATNKQIITRTNAFYGESLNYSKKRLYIPKDNFNIAFMSFEIENITNKIIAIKIPKEYIVIKKEILEDYIHYLNLNSEDWIYENDSITSKNKKIEIKIENINNFVSISIVPYS